MIVNEYKRGDKWYYRTPNKEFSTHLRHSMKSLKGKLNTESLSVQVNRGDGILYGAMRFNKRSNKPNYCL